MIEKQEAITKALEFLHESPTGVLATVSATGQPYASTIYFTYTDDFSIYFIVSHHSEKFRNLILNPAVAFAIGTGPRFEEVMIRGKAEQIADPHLRRSTIEMLKDRVAVSVSKWPIFSVGTLESGGTALVKLKPDSVQYLNLESLNDPEEHSKHIYQIIP